MKQCQNCKGNLADYVPVCPYCGVNVAVTPVGSAQLGWSGPQEKSGKATASLVCGLVFFFWPATALAAVILGHLALSDIKKSAGRLLGQGMAIAGLVLGYIGLAFVPFVLMIGAIAIPNLLRARMAANEASAVGTLRTYNIALVTYASQCPVQGYPPKLDDLPSSARDHYDCPKQALKGAVLGGSLPPQHGYDFTYYPAAVDAGGHVSSYFINADPMVPGSSGSRHFYTDETGVIRFDAQKAATGKSEPL